MRLLFITIVFSPCLVLSQETKSFSLYGEFGYGYSQSNYSLADGGISLNLGVTIGSNNWLVKYARRTNNEGALTSPQEKINCNSFLFGRSITLLDDFDEAGQALFQCNLTAYVGIGSVENQRRGKILRTYPGGVEYEHIVEDGSGYPVELELQFIKPPFGGGAISLFYNFNAFRNFYGINLIIFGGYFWRNLTSGSS